MDGIMFLGRLLDEKYHDQALTISENRDTELDA